MIGFRYELERFYDKMSEEIVRFLTRLRDSMLGLARDCQAKNSFFSANVRIFIQTKYREFLSKNSKKNSFIMQESVKSIENRNPHTCSENFEPSLRFLKFEISFRFRFFKTRISAHPLSQIFESFFGGFLIKLIFRSACPRSWSKWCPTTKCSATARFQLKRSTYFQDTFFFF